MPSVAEAPVKAYAHCRNARCAGNDQVEVDGVRREVSVTYGENGGDGVFSHMVERSIVEFVFADESKAACVACGEAREVSGEPRPQYQALSGHDQNGLLYAQPFNASAQAARVERVEFGQESDEEMELRLRAKIREEQVEARLRAELEQG